MSTYIKVSLWVLVISTFIAIQLMAADLSSQHAEFLKMLFWDAPCMVIERLLPGIGS